MPTLIYMLSLIEKIKELKSSKAEKHLKSNINTSKKDLASFLAKNDPRGLDIETTSEARGKLPVYYKYWIGRLEKYDTI